MSKFRYVIFPEYIYRVTVDDYEGKPYTFEITGKDIAQHFRREKLLDRQFEDMYNEKENGETDEK